MARASPSSEAGLRMSDSFIKYQASSNEIRALGGVRVRGRGRSFSPDYKRAEVRPRDSTSA